MPDIASPRISWFRFKLRSLLYAVVVLALLLSFGTIVFEWYFAVPTFLLADEVAAFNSRAMGDPVGQYEPRITDAEIVAVIQAQLPNLLASKEVKTIYSDIVRTRRIPQGSHLHSMPGWTLATGQHYTVWWINLSVPGYGLRIRENNRPIAKPENEPVLEFNDKSWIPVDAK